MSIKSEREDRVERAAQAVVEYCKAKGGVYSWYVTDALAREFAKVAIDAADEEEE